MLNPNETKINRSEPENNFSFGYRTYSLNLKTSEEQT